MADHRNMILQNGTSKLFVKEFFLESVLLKELGGYEIVAQYYPVPKLLNKDSCLSESKLIFEFEETIGLNKGLLLDIFNGSEVTDDFGLILEMYRSVFNRTLEKAEAPAADVFYKDRAKELKKKYRVFCVMAEDVEMNFKGSLLSINFFELVNNIVSYFTKEGQRTIWSIISQADPTDLNIGTKPVLLDYFGGGRVPLMAEFANIIWEQVALSAVLAPVYNSKMYVEHDLVYKNVPMILLKKDGLEFFPPKDRILFLVQYTLKVIMPIMERINYPDWYRDLKNHIAMRIIGVFDINKFSQEHRLLALGYLGLFYNTWDPKTPLELVELIKR